MRIALEILHRILSRPIKFLTRTRFAAINFYGIFPVLAAKFQAVAFLAATLKF